MFDGIFSKHLLGPFDLCCFLIQSFSLYLFFSWCPVYRLECAIEVTHYHHVGDQSRVLPTISFLLWNWVPLYLVAICLELLYYVGIFLHLMSMKFLFLYCLTSFGLQNILPDIKITTFSSFLVQFSSNTLFYSVILRWFLSLMEMCVSWRYLFFLIQSVSLYFYWRFKAIDNQSY